MTEISKSINTQNSNYKPIREEIKTQDSTGSSLCTPIVSFVKSLLSKIAKLFSRFHSREPSNLTDQVTPIKANENNHKVATIFNRFKNQEVREASKLLAKSDDILDVARRKAQTLWGAAHLLNQSADLESSPSKKQALKKAADDLKTSGDTVLSKGKIQSDEYREAAHRLIPAQSIPSMSVGCTQEDSPSVDISAPNETDSNLRQEVREASKLLIAKSDDILDVARRKAQTLWGAAHLLNQSADLESSPSKKQALRKAADDLKTSGDTVLSKGKIQSDEYRKAAHRLIPAQSIFKMIHSISPAELEAVIFWAENAQEDLLEFVPQTLENKLLTIYLKDHLSFSEDDIKKVLVNDQQFIKDVFGYESKNDLLKAYKVNEAVLGTLTAAAGMHEVLEKENPTSLQDAVEGIEISDENHSADKSINKTVEENLDRSLKIGSFSIDENFNVETIVEFNQSNIIHGGQPLPEKLIKINLKFNGLCELICNKVLLDDLLGKGEGDFLKKKINVDELNKESIVKSHLLNVYSFFSKMVAFIFGIYEDNIFSIKNQWNLVNKNEVNKDILFNGLKKIDLGTTLKLEVFKKTSTSFYGHSLLIKKTNEHEFTFFDPNTGEHRGLSQEGLALKINDQLAQWGGTDIFISRGDTYIKRLRDKNIIDQGREV